MKQLYFAFLLIFLNIPLFANEDIAQAKLQATISVVPILHQFESGIENLGKISPGSKIKLSATIKNTGSLPNTAGNLYIRYIFPEPLTDQPNSLLFKTDAIAVPSITPGQEIVLKFSTDQNWPSLFEFIRYDWGMRQYQAIFAENGEEKLIGTLSILFSAYYYEGPVKEIPVEIPAIKPVNPNNKEKPHLQPAVTRNAKRPVLKRHLKRPKQLQTADELITKSDQITEENDT